jgi:hypothetical protein
MLGIDRTSVPFQRRQLRRRSARCKIDIERGTGVHETEAGVCVRRDEGQVSKFVDT